mgnify:CR=1 FL=1
MIVTKQTVPIDGGVSSIFCESVSFVAFVLISPKNTKNKTSNALISITRIRSGMRRRKIPSFTEKCMKENDKK